MNLSTTPVSNAETLLREAMEFIAAEFEYSTATNTYAKELPLWACEVRNRIHTATGHLGKFLEFTAPAIGKIAEEINDANA